MSILHTVNKSPFEKNNLESCLRYAKLGSAVLLIEDGIYAALKDTRFEKEVATAMKDVSFYCLEPDLKARGFSAAKIIDGIKMVDYAGFVDLTIKYDKVQAWL